MFSMQLIRMCSHYTIFLVFLQVRTHFARPNFKKVLSKIATKHPYAKIGQILFIFLIQLKIFLLAAICHCIQDGSFVQSFIKPGLTLLNNSNKEFPIVKIPILSGTYIRTGCLVCVAMVNTTRKFSCNLQKKVFLQK